MLLSSVVLILREVLEAAVLVSVLLALSKTQRIGLRWFWLALPISLITIVVYAAFLGAVTDALDGAGQEATNATLQCLVYVFSLAIVMRSAIDRKALGCSDRLMQWLMAVAVICALTREGSEILIYISGFAQTEELRATLFAGSAMGAGIGLSLGMLMFVWLNTLTKKYCLYVCLLLLSLIAAGMVMQAMMLLEQVDWLPAGQAIWDSSAILSEQSIAGELLYAVLGYEATPSAIQVTIYLISLSAMAAACAYVFYLRENKGDCDAS